MLSFTGPLISLINKFIVRNEIAALTCTRLAEALSRARWGWGWGDPWGAQELAQSCQENSCFVGTLTPKPTGEWRKVKTSESKIILSLVDTVSWLVWGFAEETG